MELMRWPMAGSVSVAPPDVPKTTCSVSPAWAGAADFNRWMASNDWVCGKLKLFENWVPTDLARKLDNTRTNNQSRTTTRR